MTMLEDLREVVRGVSGVPTVSNDTLEHVNAQLALRFIRTHAEQIERDAMDAARWRYMRRQLALGSGEVFAMMSDAIPDDSEDTPDVIEPLIEKGIDAAMSKEGE